MVDENNRSRKIYKITPQGLRKLRSEVTNCLKNPVKQKSTLELGLANLPVLSKSEIITSLNRYLEELSSKKQFFEERIRLFTELGNDLTVLLFERPYRLLLAETEWLLELVKRVESDKIRLEIKD